MGRSFSPVRSSRVRRSSFWYRDSRVLSRTRAAAAGRVAEKRDLSRVLAARAAAGARKRVVIGVIVIVVAVGALGVGFSSW
jgi:hypothetical protein